MAPWHSGPVKRPASASPCIWPGSMLLAPAAHLHSSSTHASRVLRHPFAAGLPQFRQRCDFLVAQLTQVQEALGGGYLCE